MLLKANASLTGGQRKRLGAAVVELAVLSPFLGMLIVGMLTMGRVMMVQVSLNNAVRKGCAMGIQEGKGDYDIANEVIDIMHDSGFDSTKFNPPSTGSIVITVTDPSGNVLTDALLAPPGSTINVQVNIPVTSTLWFPTYLIGANTSQTESVTMQKE
jgi:Flp pilus assembly protein TadG